MHNRVRSIYPALSSALMHSWSSLAVALFAVAAIFSGLVVGTP